MIRVGLVGDDSPRLSPARAELLRASRAYVEAMCDEWLILSGVSATKFERPFRDLSFVEQLDWGRLVLSSLERRYGSKEVTFVFVASKNYWIAMNLARSECGLASKRAAQRQPLWEFARPLANMRIDDQLSWLNSNTISGDIDVGTGDDAQERAQAALERPGPIPSNILSPGASLADRVASAVVLASCGRVERPAEGADRFAALSTKPGGDHRCHLAALNDRAGAEPASHQQLATTRAGVAEKRPGGPTEDQRSLRRSVSSDGTRAEMAARRVRSAPRKKPD